MGRRNTRSKSTRSAPTVESSFASVDSNGTPSWLGFDSVQPDRAVLYGEVLSDQLFRWCCIDRLNSQSRLEDRMFSGASNFVTCFSAAPSILKLSGTASGRYFP